MYNPTAADAANYLLLCARRHHRSRAHRTHGSQDCGMLQVAIDLVAAVGKRDAFKVAADACCPPDSGLREICGAQVPQKDETRKPQHRSVCDPHLRLAAAEAEVQRLHKVVFK